MLGIFSLDNEIDDILDVFSKTQKKLAKVITKAEKRKEEVEEELDSVNASITRASKASEKLLGFIGQEPEEKQEEATPVVEDNTTKETT